MLDLSLDLFKEISQRFDTVNNDRALIWMGCGSITALAGFYAAHRGIDRRNQSRHDAHSLDPVTDNIFSQFDAEVAREARQLGVTLASLQAVESKFRDADIPEAQIANRLQDAAEDLAKLRSSLAQRNSEALALVDCGDFDAASAVLEQNRAAMAAGGAEQGGLEDIKQEAEIYADAAVIDHLRLDYCAAAEKYAAAAALVASPDGVSNAKREWRFRMDQARELFGDAREFGHRQSFLDAIEIYDQALVLVSRTDAPLEWAATHFHLGNALLACGVRDNDSDRLEQAVDAYLAALEEWTGESAPFDWAKTQNNLGDALQRLGDIENGDDRLLPAADAYRAALTEWTRESAPALWAMAQGNLGDALAVMGARTGDKNKLYEAVSAYQAALTELRRELAPLDWAMMQNNLGNALEALGEEESGTVRLRQAVEAYEAALEVRTRDAAPSSFATTNNNLGNALLALGEREGGNDLLEKAASAFRAALEERTGESVPIETAKIQINLAYTLGVLWNRTRDRRMLDQALAMLDAAVLIIKDTDEQEQISEVERARETILSAMARAA